MLISTLISDRDVQNKGNEPDTNLMLKNWRNGFEKTPAYTILLVPTTKTQLKSKMQIYWKSIAEIKNRDNGFGRFTFT